MSLTHANPIGFLATTDADAAKAFYEGTLGLEFESDDQFALVFRVGAGRTMLRIARTQAFEPLPFTVFGWQVDDLREEVEALTAKGVVFERFGFLEQDALGIWNAPGGASVAWFKDPAGNTLSLSQHPA